MILKQKYKGDIEMSEKKIAIAIDGPAGAGKSTIAKAISKKIGIVYLDTGAMYRTVALKAIRSDVDTKDESALENIVRDIDIKIEYKDGSQHVLLEGEDVSGLIRTHEISMGASNVATIVPVRLKMVELQQRIAEETSVVMDGRDIGTYVLPNADLKIFLTASADERAKRRFLEMQEKGDNSATLEEIKSDIIRRDENDSKREFAPLKKADDAIEIDSTQYSIDEVLAEIFKLLEQKGFEM